MFTLELHTELRNKFSSGKVRSVPLLKMKYVEIVYIR